MIHLIFFVEQNIERVSNTSSEHTIDIELQDMDFDAHYSRDAGERVCFT